MARQILLTGHFFFVIVRQGFVRATLEPGSVVARSVKFQL
jgi:hypothetical protein